MEKIQITLLNDNTDKQIVMFERHLQTQRIVDLQKTEIVRIESNAGEMGHGKFTKSVNAFVDTIKSVPEIIKSSLNFSVKFRTDIKLNFSNIELTLKYNSQAAQQSQIDQLTAKIDQLLQAKQNSIVVYGDGNTIVQDVKANSIDIK